MADKISNINRDNPGLSDITRFYGFYGNPYRDPFVNTNAFIFVTKPQLFIDPIKPNRTDAAANLAYMNMTKDPFFTQYIISESMNPLDLQIVKSLSYKNDYSESSFLPIFTNECKSFNPTDITMESNDGFDTKQGFREPLPTFKTQSEAANTISIPMVEDSNLSIIKLLSLWVNYISNITDGTFDANPEMIASGTLDYTSSIYYFVLNPDGKTLKYWARYTGCWPTNIPYSSLQYSKGAADTTEVSADFQYTVKEDMNPKILEEFNMVSLKLIGSSAFSAKKLRDEIDGLYSSITQSPLLNRTAMLNADMIPNARTLLESDHRDPIIFYKEPYQKGVNPDEVAAHFELVFDDYGYTPNYLDGIMDSDNFIHDEASNTAKTENAGQSEWNMQNFWNEEE